MSKWAIEAEDVGKRYRLGEGRSRERLADLFVPWRRDAHSREFWALRDVSFRVEKGESVGIIGHNGAGKSTLLKVLSRITAPTAGRVRIAGRVGTLLEVGTGFHPELSGRENIFLSGSILGLTRAHIKSKFDEIVEFSEIGKFIDTPIKRYSSGMQVRLAFSVALYLDPEILIIDEVLAVGDLGFQQKSVGQLRDASTRGGRAVLFVSHSLEAVRRLCHRVIVLDEGKMKFDGPADQAVAYYRKSVPVSAAPLQYESLSDDLVDEAGFARFTAVEAFDQEGLPKWSFVPGETARLRFRFELTKPVADLSFLLRLMARDPTDATTHDIVTDIHKIVSNEPLAQGYCGAIEVELENLKLRPGTFWLYLRLGDAGDKVSYVTASKNLPTLSLINDSDEGRLGLVSVDYEFESKSTEARPSEFLDLEVVCP